MKCFRPRTSIPAKCSGLLALGILIVTLRVNFPLYDAMMGWQGAAPGGDWQHVRGRFHTMNFVRFSLALAAHISFLVALLMR